jgi:hypothetical protein
MQKFGSLALDDGLIILATACLWGDLIIQQYMWHLGMANIPGATPEQFKKLMQVRHIFCLETTRRFY